MILLNSILGKLPISLISHSVNQKRPDTFQKKLSVSQKVMGWTKERAILIIIVEGCSILMCVFGFIFTVL